MIVNDASIPAKAVAVCSHIADGGGYGERLDTSTDLMVMHSALGNEGKGLEGGDGSAWRGPPSGDEHVRRWALSHGSDDLFHQLIDRVVERKLQPKGQVVGLQDVDEIDL